MDWSGKMNAYGTGPRRVLRTRKLSAEETAEFNRRCKEQVDAFVRWQQANNALWDFWAPKCPDIPQGEHHEGSGIMYTEQGEILLTTQSTKPIESEKTS